MAELPSTNTVWKSIKPFVNGGASGMLATCVIQPIDMVKVRIQLGAQGSPVGALTSRSIFSLCVLCSAALEVVLLFQF